MSVLTRVQLNPEIGTDDSTFVTDLVAMAKNFVVSYCNLPRFPELAVGYSRGAVNPTLNLTGIASNTLLLSIAEESPVPVEVVLANCISGTTTAAELQRVIQALSSVSYPYDEITVTYNGTPSTDYYEISGSRYTEHDEPEIGFYEQTKHLAQAMKLSETYGGTEFSGTPDNPQLIDAAVEICTQLYRRVGIEGFTSTGLQGETNASISTMLDKATLSRLQRYRRLW